MNQNHCTPESGRFAGGPALTLTGGRPSVSHRASAGAGSAMRRGHLIVAILSAAGGVLAFVIAAVLRDPASLYTVLGVLLLANAAVRLRLAGRRPA